MYLLNTLTHTNKSKPVTTFQIKHTIIKYQVSTITREFQHGSNININFSIIVITSNISSSTAPRRSNSAALQNSQVVLEKHYTNIHNGCWTRIYNWYTIQLHIWDKKWRQSSLLRLIVCSFNACVIMCASSKQK